MYPIFISDDPEHESVIDSLPGQKRWGVDRLEGVSLGDGRKSDGGRWTDTYATSTVFDLSVFPTFRPCPPLGLAACLPIFSSSPLSLRRDSPLLFSSVFP